MILCCCRSIVVGIACPADVHVFAEPGATTARVNWLEPTLTDWEGATNFTSSSDPGDEFSIGTRNVTYNQWFERFSVECSFVVTVQGE